MEKETKRGPKKKVAFLRVAAFLLLFFFFVNVTWAFTRRYLEYRNIQKRIQATQREIDQVREVNVRLRQQKEALHDPRVIEEVARTKLGLAKPKELVIKVLPSSSRQTHASDSPPEPEKGTMEKVMDFFQRMLKMRL